MHNHSNLVIYQRNLSADLSSAINKLMAANHSLQLTGSVSTNSVENDLLQNCPQIDDELIHDIRGLVSTFCALFHLKTTYMRLAIVQKTMCPRFHVDSLNCRLVTTYSGSCTEWLPDQLVDRTKLGPGNRGFSDEFSGVYRSTEDIQHLSVGDVGLMKGKLWKGSEGLVHRSPTLKAHEPRLLLSLDFC